MGRLSVPSVVFRIGLATLGIAVSAVADSGGKGDKPTAAAGSAREIIDEGTEFRDGVRYRVFSQGALSVRVPTFWNLSPEDFEAATCVDRADGNHGRERALVRVDAPASSDVKVYAELIQRAIRTRCRGDQLPVRVPVDPHFDLGVEVSPRSKKPGDPSVRVFNRDLGKNLNLGFDF